MIAESPHPSTPMIPSPSDMENFSPEAAHATWNLTPANTSESESSMNSEDVEMEKTPEVPPQRKSRRLHKEINSDDNELLANFHDGLGVVDRGTKIPIGLVHIPFVFKKKDLAKVERQKNKLRIAMVPVFNKINTPNIENSTSNSKSLKSKPGLSEIQIGANYQADIPEYRKDSESRLDRDELIWTPPEESFDYDICRNEYWRAIWRQFNGQIPFETALQNLMKSGYSFGKSLETIDQNLKFLPQKFKSLGENQCKQFEKLLMDKTFARRTLQEKAMKNYHIAEVQNFYHEFKNFYLGADNKEVCNCRDPLCKDLQFVPRWACSNCTKSVRINAQSSENLCLICQSYQHLTGKTRPADDVIFNDEDSQKIREWNQMEITEKRTNPLAVFEKIQEEKDINRWMSNKLTEEEEDMIDSSVLPHRRRWNQLKEVDQKEIGAKIVEQLTPHSLPLFKKCECESDVENGPSEVKVMMSREMILASYRNVNIDEKTGQPTAKKQKLQ